MSAQRGLPRAVACATVMALLFTACNGPSDSRKETANTGTPQIKSTGPFVTEISGFSVASGDFTNDSLVRAILDSVAAAERGGKPDPWDKKHDRMDARRLMQGSCGPESKQCVPGPYVEIVPRKNIHTNQTLGAGRVIGKLINREANFPYTKLALYQGTPEAYWWVGVRPGKTDTISVYVPSDWNANKPAKWRAATVMLTDPNDPKFQHTQSSARFVWNDQDDETWGTCVQNGCCQPPAVVKTTQASGGASLDS